jgi:hypothetical protein
MNKNRVFYPKEVNNTKRFLTIGFIACTMLVLFLIFNKLNNIDFAYKATFLIVSIFIVISASYTKPDSNNEKFEILTRTIETIMLLFGGYILWKEFVLDHNLTASVIQTIASIINF